MTLGLILSIGESFTDLKKHGQDRLIVEQNIKYYLKTFDEILIFSYANESYTLPKKVKLIKNDKNTNRFLYSIIMPLVKSSEFRKCNVLRGFQITGGLPCLLANVIYKKPFVINYGYDYSQVALIEKRRIKAILYKLLTPIIIKLADAVIVTTKSLKSKIKNIRQKNVYLIPNNVDTGKFSPNNSTAKKIGILFVGRLEPQKNLANLLQAVAALKMKQPTVFIGRGSQKKKLLNFAKEKNVNLSIIDYVAHDKLPNVLNQSKIFVLPSLYEGHPKALIEAMSAGLPCIGTKVPGIKDLLVHKKTGIIVDTNPASLKKGLESVIRNEKLAAKLRVSARKYAIENFDSAVILRRETKLLERMAK